MGMVAGNPLVGGTQLRRAAIASSNYVPGTSGWSINEDGSAEFRNIVLPDGVKGSTITIGAVAPSSPHQGDLWMDTSNGLRVNQWDGSAWVPYQFGTDAIADSSITTALVNFTARDIGGITTAVATSAPASPQDGDLWYDSSNGYKLNQYEAGAWTAYQFGTNAIANGAITSGQVNFTARDIGGITTTVSAAAPASPKDGDLWYDSSNGYKLNQYEAGAWTAYQFGTDAIEAGSITAALIEANTITAAQIASGTITAAQIQAGTITATEIAANTITAALIAANTITAAQLAAGIVYAGIVDGTLIQGASIVADGSSGEFLVYSGSPAAGNLIASVSAVSGIDSKGNAYNQGIVNYSDGSDNVFISLNSGHIFMGSMDSSSKIALAGQLEVIDTLNTTSPPAISLQAPTGIVGSTAHIDLFGESADGATAEPQISLVTPQASIIMQNLLVQLSTGLFLIASDPATGLPESWHNFTLASGGWSAGTDSNGTSYPPQYRLMPDGSVALRGVLGTPTSGTVLGVAFNSVAIPPAYRPASGSPLPTATVAQASGGHIGQVEIHPNGNVELQGGFNTSEDIKLDCTIRIN